MDFSNEHFRQWILTDFALQADVLSHCASNCRMSMVQQVFVLRPNV